MSNAAYVRVWEGTDGQWYYESVALNWQILSTSEGYTRKEDAVYAATAEHPDAVVYYGKDNS